MLSTLDAAPNYIPHNWFDIAFRRPQLRGQGDVAGAQVQFQTQTAVWRKRDIQIERQFNIPG